MSTLTARVEGRSDQVPRVYSKRLVPLVDVDGDSEKKSPRRDLKIHNEVLIRGGAEKGVRKREQYWEGMRRCKIALATSTWM